MTPAPSLSWLAAAKPTTDSLTVQDIADGSVQVLAWVKYGAIYFAACLAARTDPAKADHSREQYILMAIIGLTDVFAYAANCLGVAFCGATRAALILAATQQVFTAVLSYILLGRRLSSQQVSGVRTWLHCRLSVLRTLLNSLWPQTSAWLHTDWLICTDVQNHTRHNA